MWLRGFQTRSGLWRGRQFVREGARWSELEFQRYQPREILRKLLKGCDIIQVIGSSPACAWSVCGLGKPVAVLFATRAILERRRRDSETRGPVAMWRRWMTGFTDSLDRRVLQSADAIEVMNASMYDYATLVNGTRDVIIVDAPPGIDAQHFCPLPGGRTQRPYVLCVGRLDDPRKNVGLLLDAYGSLPRQAVQETRLILAGSAGPPASFWSKVASLGLTRQVEFIASPDPETLVRLYQNASIFALPSDEEGFGVVLLEAMACGVPVVSTRTDGAQGMVTDEVNGYLVAPNDHLAMSKRLRDLLLDEGLNRRMSTAARQAVLSRYEAGVAGKVFMQVYDKLLFRSMRVPAASQSAQVPTPGLVK